ncbi:TPA: hypothetical protein N0F65_006960 [Lagenidium giganteum]|uniref:Ubiquitinyl hydrolase 1 n=1 Tax=Lagenidium giganteum TaxID=4803 RepID=A0AAV2ZD66_9STRA|nr:TPA: hypothetical protein N0F65_006960 [Lagenidium giganteum]
MAALDEARSATDDTGERVVIMSAPSPPQQVVITVDGDDDTDDDDAQRAHRQRMSSALATLPKPKDDNVSAGTSTSRAIVPIFSAQTAAHGEDGDEDDDGGGGGSGGYGARSRNAFTGLSNQGATCYMNSLLQTLYMTPEFRQGLYRWRFRKSRGAGEDEDDEEEEEDNIPFQLQILFARLQMTTQEAISTKALTKSFGWTGADVFQQHDVQELCRVLFDALEKSFKGTVNETMVNDLYQGSLKDYVKCCECGYESSRVDNFLDLSLVIRPFGSERLMKSVEEAIELFLKPEVLDKENQWNCDQCKVKRDAIKGLKFSRLPYLLSLQLKRFDFDYTTFNRIKLHSEVTFPKYLDMNSYVSEESGGRKKGTIARKMSMERHELEGKVHKEAHAQNPVTGTGQNRIRRMSSMDETNPSSFDLNEGEDGLCELDTWNPAFDPEVLIKRSGPHVYELSSILIHSGSALGGHYYAYIKSFETGKWYNFNDSNVSLVSDNELKNAFGGASSGYGSRVSYSTCAYMLMYRLVSKEKNVNVIPPSDIPSYLTDRITADEEKRRRQELERIEMAKKLVVKVFMKGRSPKPMDKTLHFYRASTIEQMVDDALKEFAKDSSFAIPAARSNVRLRGYNEYSSLLTETFTEREQKTLTELGFYPGQPFFLETKTDDEDWEDYEPQKLQLFVRQFEARENDDDVPTNDCEPFIRSMQIEPDATLASLYGMVFVRFGTSPEKQIRFLMKTTLNYGGVRVLNRSNDPETMGLRLRMDLGLSNGNTLYYEECDDLSAPSLAEEQFAREANLISVNYKYLDRAAVPIRVDRRETVRKLKEKIGAKLGLKPENFKILRGINSAGIEMKAIDSTLLKLSIGPNHTVYIVEGTPLNPGEYNFRLMFHQSESKSTASSAEKEPIEVTSLDGERKEFSFVFDTVLYQAKTDTSLTFVSNVIISEEMPVEEIRQRVYQTLVDKKLVDSARVLVNQIRLRDFQHNRMACILVDGRRLNESSDLAAYEGRTIVAQVLQAPETTELKHRIAEFVFIDRESVRFVPSLRREVVFPRALERSNPLTYIVDEASAALSMPIDHLRFAQLPSYRETMDVVEAVTFQFLPSERFAHQDHEYQETFLVVDDRVPLRTLDDAEKEALRLYLTKKSEEKLNAQKAKYSSTAYNSTSYGAHVKPKEAALVIRTKSKPSDKAKSSNASSSSRTNGVTIRTPTQRTAARGNNTQHASSDTDEEDDEAEFVEPEDVDISDMA